MYTHTHTHGMIHTTSYYGRQLFECFVSILEILANIAFDQSTLIILLLIPFLRWFYKHLNYLSLTLAVKTYTFDRKNSTCILYVEWIQLKKD